MTTTAATAKKTPEQKALIAELECEVERVEAELQAHQAAHTTAVATIAAATERMVGLEERAAEVDTERVSLEAEKSTLVRASATEEINQARLRQVVERLDAIQRIDAPMLVELVTECRRAIERAEEAMAKADAGHCGLKCSLREARARLDLWRNQSAEVVSLRAAVLAHERGGRSGWSSDIFRNRARELDVWFVRRCRDELGIEWESGSICFGSIAQN